MAFFNAKKKKQVVDSETGEVIEIKEDMVCDVCGKDLSVFSKNKVVTNFYICDDCSDKSAIFRHKDDIKNLSSDAIKSVITEKVAKYNSFHTKRRIEDYIFIDTSSRTWTIPYQSGVMSSAVRVDPACIYKLDTIKDYKLVEDNVVLLEGAPDMPEANSNAFLSMKNLPGDYVDGKAANCTNLTLQIETTMEHLKFITIDLIDKKTPKNKDFYKSELVVGMQIIALFDKIFHEGLDSSEAQTEEVAEQSSDTSDEATTETVLEDNN